MLLKFLHLIIHADTLSSVSQSSVMCATLHIPKHAKGNNSQNKKTQQTHADLQPRGCVHGFPSASSCHLQHEADGALRKARLLQSQRQEEYEKAKVSTSRLEEELNVVGGGAATAKQLEKRRRLEEETLQKVKNRLFDDFSVVYLTFIAHSGHFLHQQHQCCINLLCLI